MPFRYDREFPSHSEEIRRSDLACNRRRPLGKRAASRARMLLIGAASIGLAGLTWFNQQVYSQLPPTNGMRQADVRSHAIVDATVVPEPGQKIEHATIVMRDGVIVAVGPKDQVKVPPEARVWKGEGMTVYPGLIESALLIKPADRASGAGSHWNTRIRPETNMIDQPAPDKSLRKDLRSLGFTAAAVYPSSGAMRGSGALLALADDNEHVLAYKSKTAMAMAFDYGGGGRRGGGGGDENASAYPGSLMGSIALLRQTLLDAQWHADCMNIWRKHPEGNEPPLRADALEALADVLDSQHRQQVLFDVSDEYNALRAAKLAREFNLDMILLGSGYEFRQLKEVIDARMPIIVPLEFPKRPDVSTIAAADSVSLRDLMTWEQAPTNPRRLVNAGATIALTTHRLKSRSDFASNLRSAIKHGLTEDQALAALTTTPAKLLGVENMMGTIAPGKVANLVVVKGSLFDKDRKVYDTWVDGRRFEVNSDAEVQLKGSGTLKIQNPNGQSPPQEMKVDVNTEKSSVTIYLPDKKKVSAKKVVVQQDQISFLTDGRPLGVEGYVQFSGVIEGKPPKSITGTGMLPDNSTFRFTIEITSKSDDKDADNVEAKPDDKHDDKPEAAEHKAETPADPVSGSWNVRFDEMREGMTITYTLKLEGRNVTGSIFMMGREREISGGTFDPATGKLSFTSESPAGDSKAVATVAGDTMTGTITSQRGDRNFTATRHAQGSAASAATKDDEKFVMPPEELNYPLGEYGLMSPPAPQNVLIINATIWTCGPQGVIKNGWMRVGNGKVLEVGSGDPPSANAGITGITIDAKGKHVTPGLIDCHSHTGIFGGVNEFAQTNTAECRIADCIDPTDIDWYRQLAGGLVAANQLHGSANPIGGQNSVVKIKWGAAGGPEAFPIRDAIPGIKFALGENVKRSQGRYPNTRMGVETFIRDAFTAAKDYKAKWDRYNALPSEKKATTMPPQRDLELDTLVEILNHQRIIHCHSYRQDEILMLVRIADSFGFHIGTFQHVLEGYKVADALLKHGAGGSTFSDWWAYKIEVMDAIPYNGTLMHDVGMTVSFNSDSDELARRLNWEAAKAIKYGGCTPEEALKFVTINPAKQLRLDSRTGSLEVGKDADFVIWSGDPLSAYTRCEQTWIEGAKYFDIETDQHLREHIRSERQRLIQKILAQAHGEPAKAAEENKSDAKPDADAKPAAPSISKAHLAWMEEQVRLGRDPNETRPGECGCDEE